METALIFILSKKNLRTPIILQLKSFKDTDFPTKNEIICDKNSTFAMKWDSHNERFDSFDNGFDGDSFDNNNLNNIFDNTLEE